MSHKRTKPAADKVVEDLLDLKLDIFVISADPEAGVSEVAARIAIGRLKVFSTCTEWLAQYRAYRRDKAGDLIEESNSTDRRLPRWTLASKRRMIGPPRTRREIRLRDNEDVQPAKSKE